MYSKNCFYGSCREGHGALVLVLINKYGTETNLKLDSLNGGNTKKSINGVLDPNSETILILFSNYIILLCQCMLLSWPIKSTQVSQIIPPFIWF